MLRRFMELSLSLIMEHKNCKLTVVILTKFATMCLIVKKNLENVYLFDRIHLVVLKY